MKRIIYIVLACAAMLSTSCTDRKPTDKSVKKPATTVRAKDENGHKHDVLRSEISSPASKGIIKSVVDVPVFSLLSSVVTDVNVKLGQKVTAGQPLITLNSTEIQNEINLCQSQIEQAHFQYESIIVGQGYDTSNPAAIPDKINKAARIRSSLPVYEQQLQIYKQQLEYTHIKAPVSGVVSDMKIHKHELAQQGVALCRIIDPDHLMVDFTILESEVSLFHIGSVVNVTTVAYPQEVHKATVTGIKPQVEETGMLFIRATLEDNVHLMAGMTALVALEK